METTRRDEVTRLEGIIPAILTPFTGQGTVDLATLRRLVRFLMESQVGGFYVNGSTGEWSKLTIEERKAIAETVVSEVDGRVPGHFNGAFALDLARHAKAIGADIVSSVFPSPDASRNEIIRYYCSLASVGLPVIVYYLERQDGWGNFTENFLSIFGTIDRVEGVKYTGKDLYAMYCIHYLSEGRLTVWSGYDQMALAGLIMGAKGVIGANYNYIPEIYVAMYRAYRSGDLARAQELQSEANQVLCAVKKFGNKRAYRAALKLRGCDIGPCRPPTIPLSVSEVQELEAAILPFARRFEKIG